MDGYITFDTNNPIHEKAVHLSIPRGQEGWNLPVYCLNNNYTSHAGKKHVYNMAVDEPDKLSTWYYTPIGANKIKNGKTIQISTANGMYGHYTLTKIMQMQYIAGANVESGKSLTRDNWSLSKQVAIWMVAMEGWNFPEGGEPYYDIYTARTIDWYAERFGVNDDEKKDVKNNTKKLYYDSLAYAEEMSKEVTWDPKKVIEDPNSIKEKSLSISADGTAQIYSTGDSTYKIGPFKLDYDNSIYITNIELEVNGNNGKIALDNLYYEYNTGTEVTRTTKLPASGKSFYIHIKNLEETFLIKKVSIKYNWETYRHINLYEAISEDVTETQPVLLVERRTL